MSWQERPGEFSSREHVQGRGWLRVPAYGSTTATYDIEIECDAHGVAIEARGVLRADISMMIEARACGRASLVLENGQWLSIDVLFVSAAELSFEATDEKRPIFQGGGSRQSSRRR